MAEGAVRQGAGQGLPLPGHLGVGLSQHDDQGAADSPDDAKGKKLPGHELMMGEYLDACKLVSGSVATFHWASAEFLKEHEVAPWSDMPVWIPDTEEDAGFSRVDVSRAIDAGLKFRPLEDTLRDTIQWADMRPEVHEWRAGLNPTKEQILLTLLKRNDQ